MLAAGRHRTGAKAASGGDEFVDLSSALRVSLIESEQIDNLLDAAGVDGVRSILEAFWRSTDKLSAELMRNVSEGEFAEAARAAHALKGSAANVGANRLAEAARIVETLSKSGDIGAAKEALVRLAAIYRETRDALERHMAARV
jgi:HPt (histidine-containing phosphotransfer) domain-containing protein